MLMTHELWDMLEDGLDCSWAVVQAGGQQTRYLRAGKGPSVILLPDHSRPGRFWTAILERLAEGHRVLVPDYGGAPGDFATWFRGFVEGIGVPAAALVANEELALAALECALLEPELVTHLALLPATAAAGPIEGHLSGAGSLPQIPVLIVQADLSARDGVATLDAFLRTPRPSPVD